jgi:hypothetical protein
VHAGELFGGLPEAQADLGVISIGDRFDERLTRRPDYIDEPANVGTTTHDAAQGD